MSNSTASELDALPGLESAKRVVLSLAEAGTGQGILFYGLPGSGKRQLARILAKAFLCTNPSAGACGECQACRTFERERSADILWIEPKGASRIIRVAAISPSEEDADYPVSAQAFLRTPPLSARSKVVVIEDADRLNPRAANSLLKTLEEPPPYGRFILLTEAVGSILPTILSRSVAVACETPKHLEGVEDWAVLLAGGAPLRAQDLMTHAKLYKPLYDFGYALPSRRRQEALAAAEQFAGLCEALSDSRKLGARAGNAEGLECLAKAYGANPNHSAAGLQAIVEAHRRVLGNANAGSVFDALFAQVLRR